VLDNIFSACCFGKEQPLETEIRRDRDCLVVQSVPITTDVVSSNLGQGEVYTRDVKHQPINESYYIRIFRRIISMVIRNYRMCSICKIFYDHILWYKVISSFKRSYR
jgi:hypothetical protein